MKPKLKLVCVLVICRALHITGDFLLFPVIPFYIMQLSGTALDLSLVSSVYCFAKTFSTPAWGYVSDKISRPKCLMLGYLWQGAMTFGIAYPVQIPIFLVFRALVGMGSTAAVEVAYITDSVRNSHERAVVLSVQSMLGVVGVLVGTALSGYLQKLGLVWSDLCYIVGTLDMINWVLIFVARRCLIRHRGRSVRQTLLPTESSNVPRESAVSRAYTLQSQSSFVVPIRYRDILSHKGAGFFLALSFMNSFGWTVSDGPELFFFKDHFNFTQTDYVRWIMLVSTCSAVFATLAPTILYRLGQKETCMASCIISSLTMTGLLFGAYYLPGQKWVAFVYGVISCGLLHLLLHLANTNLLANTCPSHMRGSLLGLKGSIGAFGGMLGPITGGLLYRYNSFVAYIITVALFLIAALCYVFVHDKRKREPSQILKSAVFKVKALRFMAPAKLNNNMSNEEEHAPMEPGADCTFKVFAAMSLDLSSFQKLARDLMEPEPESDWQETAPDPLEDLLEDNRTFEQTASFSSSHGVLQHLEDFIRIKPISYLSHGMEDNSNVRPLIDNEQ